MMIFELDLSNCDLPPSWAALPKIIRATEGRHQLDFDILDPAVNKKAREIPTVLGNPDLPVGFNALLIPVGAVLRRLADSDKA